MSGSTRTTEALLTTAWVANAVPLQPHRSAEQGAGVVRRAADLAGQAASGGAPRARAAPREEGHDHAVAEFEAGDTLAEDIDDARSLVPEEHRGRTHTISIDDGEVGVADPGHLDAHQQFSGPRGIQLQPADRQGSGCREWRLRPAVLEYRADDLH
jgi:hypothetical protein